MQHTSLVSDTLISMGYDETTHTLELTFNRDGSVYQYANVPADVAAGLQAAADDDSASAGIYFHAHIRAVYPARRVMKR